MQTPNTTSNDKAQLKAFFLLLLKNWYYFVISLAVCGAVAVVYLKIKTPVMEVVSTVMLRENDGLAGGGGMSSSQNNSMVSALLGSTGGSHNINDEITKMASQGFIKQIVKEMKLNKMYTQLEYMGLMKTKLYDQAPVELVTEPSMNDTLTNVLVIKLKKKGQGGIAQIKYGKEKIGTFKFDSFPARLETQVGPIVLAETAYADNYPGSYNMKVVMFNYNAATQIIREKLVVDSDKKGSNIIMLQLEDENPFYAMELLGRIIDLYNIDWNKDKNYVHDKTIEYINQMIQEEKQFLSDADKQIQEFKDKYELTDIEADVKFYLEMSAQIQATIMEAQIQLDMVQTVYNMIKDDTNKGKTIPLITAFESDALAEAIKLYNESLIKNQELKLTSETPLTRVNDRQLETQRISLIETIAKSKEGIELSIATMQKKNDEISSRIKNIPTVERDYVELKREQEIHQTVYIFLLEKAAETGITSSAILPKLKVIDEPYMLNDPVEPNKMKALITAVLMGGIILPFCFIYGMPYIQPLFRRRKDD